MNEQQQIQDAFAATLRNLFAVFYASYTGALGDRDGEQKAEGAFKKGVIHARFVRDRALALL